MCADAALSEKSPYLGNAWVRQSLQQEPGMWPDEAPGLILLRGRDRSPSGPAPQTLYGDEYFPQPVASRENDTKEHLFRESSFLS